MKKICLAAFALFVFAGFSGAAIMEMGGDIQVRSINRNNFDLTGVTGSENWFDTYLRLYMDARPYPDVRAYIRLIGERDWSVDDGEDGSAVSADIDLAYIMLEKLWSSRADIYLGRQELSYGEGFIVGRNDRYRTGRYERSPRKAFDALRVSWGLDPFVFDVIGSVIDEGFGEDSTALIGANLNYGYYDTAGLDVGLFYLDYAGDAETIALSVRGEADVQRFPGLRVKAEVVPQLGKHSAARDLSAFGGYAGVEYLFGHEQLRCVPHFVYLNYYYMTGDDGAGDFNEFDPMFSDTFLGEVNEVNPALGLDTNANILNLGFGWHISRAVDLGFSLYRFRRNERVAGTTDFGDEIDVKFTYRYNPDTKLVLTGGYFMPEPALAEKNALQLTAALELAF